MLTIQCAHCGTKFAGKQEYAGKRIRCPQCDEVFRVVAGSEGGEPVPMTTLAPSASIAEKPHGESATPDDFEYRLQAESNAVQACPFCQHPLQDDQVLCLKCGYHTTLKQKLETKHGADAGPPPDASGFPTELDLGLFTIPLWVIGAVAGAFLLATMILYVIEPFLAAIALLVCGLALSTLGSFWVVIVAFHESALMGLAVWFVPFFWWYYVITRIEDLWVPLSVTVVGCVMLGLGLGIVDSGETIACGTLAFDEWSRRVT